MASAPASNAGRWVRYDHQPATVEPVGEQAKRLERGRICPMQVLDNQENGSTRQSPLEECAHCEVDLALELFGLDLALPGHNRAKPDDMVEREHELSALGRRQPELGDACRQLFPRLRRAIFRRYAVGAAQDRTERAEVLFAERRAGSAPHHHRGELLIVLDPRKELAHEARLANAGIADQTHHMGVASDHPFQTIEHAAQLGVAANHGRAQAERL